MTAPEPQPVLSPLTEAAIFLVVTVDARAARTTVGTLLADLPGCSGRSGSGCRTATWPASPGSGRGPWDRLFGGPRPAELHPFRELAGARHTAVATPGDLLFHIRAGGWTCASSSPRRSWTGSPGAVTVVDEVHGFKYFDDRDLLGFVDGTENPVGRRRAAAILVGAEDPAFAGGSYVIVQKYLHDMGAWNALPVEEQERVIGRTKLDDIELADDVKPANSHVALNTITDADGTERQIVRDNMPFGSRRRGEFGTYFIGYAATPAVTERMLEQHVPRRPAGQLRPDPRLLHRGHRQPVLRPERRLPRRPAGPPAGASEPAGEPAVRRRPGPRPTTDGSLGIGSLKRSTAMNNLHRELAPISEAAWADIEEEARRTFTLQPGGPPGGGRRSDRPGDTLAAVGTGHLGDADARRRGRDVGVRRSSRWSSCACRSRRAGRHVDDVERGAQDSDWQPVKDAARKIAFAEDRAVFDGYAAAGIAGIRESSSNPAAAAAGRRRGLSRRGQPGRHLAAGGRGRRAVLAAAVRRGLHRGHRDVRPRLPDPASTSPG